MSLSTPAPAQARLSAAEEILGFREHYRREMNCQIVHDSIHRRAGWTTIYSLHLGDDPVGFGAVAIGGPWQGKPTLFEFYVEPKQRTRAFDLFEALLAASGARFMEIQSNDPLCGVMLHNYARDIASEKIVFHDKITTTMPCPGATLRRITSDEDLRAHLAQRQGGAEWVLERQGQAIGKGGILFHYNLPYGDIYLDIAEPFRRRGLGSYFVQELKRAAYELGAVPCARCNPTNIASRRTLQRAGFVAFAHMLTGVLSPA